MRASFRGSALGLEPVAAASRLAVPLACVVATSTTRPLRFSKSTWPMWHNCALVFLDLRYRRASGSVVEAWVSFQRFLPLKSTSELRPAPGSGGSCPSLGPTLMRGPDLDQGDIDAEVLVRDQSLPLGKQLAGRRSVRSSVFLFAHRRSGLCVVFQVRIMSKRARSCAFRVSSEGSKSTINRSRAASSDTPFGSRFHWF